MKSPEPFKGDILIVDDTIANLRLLSTMLTRQGYKVRGVPNGALALTGAQSAPPDLILLDINMPEMNGYEVCQHLKADDRTRDIPVIFISALDEALDKVKAFTVGGVDYIAKPVQLEEVLARIENHLTLRRLQQQLQEANRELARVNDEMERRVEERTAELAQLSKAFERFVPHQFLSFLKKKSITEVELADQVEEEMTIMFSDIRDFTPLSERMSPQENFNFLNSYLSRVSPVISKHNGFIDKYIGDEIMALFPERAQDALEAAIALRGEVGIYNSHREKCGYGPVSIGTSLHTGHLMLGIIGGAERLEGTVVADAVNLAARLEGLNRVYETAIIISEETLDRLEDRTRYHFRYVDKARVKGKNRPVLVYEVYDGDAEEVLEAKEETKADFEEGVRLYQDGFFDEASERFERVLKRNPEDRATKLYIRRSAHFMVHDLPPGWGG